MIAQLLASKLTQLLCELSPSLVPPLQAKQQLQFRLPLAHSALSFLWDHQVQAAPIMPGAAYFEMAAAAGRTLLRLAEPAVAVTGATIAAPLRLPAVAEAGTVTVTADVALTTGGISIRSAAGQAGKAVGGKAAAETLHLQGSLSVAAAGAVIAAAPHVLSLDAARAACRQPQDTAAVYSGLSTAGLQYGPAFRQLRSVQRGDSSAAARLGSGPAQTDTDVSGFLVHPALLDSGLQLGALVPDAAAAASSEGGAFVPAGLAVYLIQRPVQQGSGVHAFVRRGQQDGHKAGSTFRDHALLSDTGTVLAVLDGLEAKQLGGSTAANTAAAAKQQAAELLYNVAWQAASLATEVAAPLADAAVQKLPAGTAVPLAPASGGLLVLQHAMQQQAGTVQLRTVADAAPGSIAAAGTAQAASSGNALWGMLRAFAQEAPAVSHSGVRLDPLASSSTTSRSSLLVSASTASDKASDGYGSLVQAGSALSAVLLPSSAAQPVPGPYHLMPRPRGAFRWVRYASQQGRLLASDGAQQPRQERCPPTMTVMLPPSICRNLVPEPVPVGTAQPGWVEVEVKAVGINFRWGVGTGDWLAPLRIVARGRVQDMSTHTMRSAPFSGTCSTCWACTPATPALRAATAPALCPVCRLAALLACSPATLCLAWPPAAWAATFMLPPRRWFACQTRSGEDMKAVRLAHKLQPAQCG